MAKFSCVPFGVNTRSKWRKCEIHGGWVNIVVIFQPFASQSSPNFGNMQETL